MVRGRAPSSVLDYTQSDHFVFRSDILIQNWDENCHRYGVHTLLC